MADVSGLRRRVERFAQETQRAAATRMVNGLSGRTPRVTGEMDRREARQRVDTQDGTVSRTHVRQEAGGSGRPDQLPNWLDEGRQFIIRPRRPGGVLAFRGLAGQVVFRRQVLWNRSQRSRGFWSETMTQDRWHDALREEASGRTLPP